MYNLLIYKSYTNLNSKQSGIGQHLHEIVSLDDPSYDDWLDIYQKSFPLSEQILVSEHNKSLRKDGAKGERTEIYLISLDSEDKPTGIARVNRDIENSAACLWYLAVSPNLRGAGIGSWLYNQVIELVTSRGRCDAMEFEVELPERCENEESRLLAQRRIEFYRRQGAKLFGGIHYVQVVDWQPPIPMGVMVHPFTQMTPDDALILAEKVLGQDIERIGEVTLE
jgi:GNAT superfamily N-acetyltransferase